MFLVSLIGDSVGLFLCCLQQFTFSLCSGVQILMLLLISVKRLLAIAFPFKMRNEEWILFIRACGLRSSVADNVIIPVTSCASIYKGHQGHARAALVCRLCAAPRLGFVNDTDNHSLFLILFIFFSCRRGSATSSSRPLCSGLRCLLSSR